MLEIQLHVILAVGAVYKGMGLSKGDLLIRLRDEIPVKDNFILSSPSADLLGGASIKSQWAAIEDQHKEAIRNLAGKTVSVDLKGSVCGTTNLTVDMIIHPFNSKQTQVNIFSAKDMLFKGLSTSSIKIRGKVLTTRDYVKGSDEDLFSALDKERNTSFV